MRQHETVIHQFWERAASQPQQTAILHKVSGEYQAVSWESHGRTAALITAALIALGLSRGERAAIMSTSRPQWTWADVGIMSAGGVTVPVYPSLNALEALYILEHSGARVVFVESPGQLAKLDCPEVARLPLTHAVLFEGDRRTAGTLEVLTFNDLLDLGTRELGANPDLVASSVAMIKPSDLATIVYTSGTTGVPKGAMIHHGNISFVCRTLSETVGFKDDDVSLSFLPLSHIFERIGGQFLAIHEGITMAYAETMESVGQNALEIGPTIMNGVPRFYEKVYNRIQSHIRQLPAPQQYFSRWALSMGKRAYKAAHGDGLLAQKLYRTELRIADRFVYSKIRDRMGGRLRYLISGAAPLSGEIHQFFEIIGLPILEGYGLTETTAPVACNQPEARRRGTVGRPLPGVEVRIADDGEIMVKGPNVFSGYFKNPEATERAFSDGWFMTGDIGTLDEDGYLRILDRKKDIIITAGGKHVAPQMIENLLAGQGLISRVLVYGDRRKYITALLTLSDDELAKFAEEKAITIPYDQLNDHPLVLQEVQRVVDEANGRLATFEQIKRFLILDRDFSIEANELTPTLKLKRKEVTRRYKHLLDSMYDAADIHAETAR